MENKPETVGSLLRIFQAELKNTYNDKEIKQLIVLLLHEWKGWNKAQVQLNRGELLSKVEIDKLCLALKELKRYKPIQYITGRTYFHDLELLVTPDVLIPRPETEELVDMIIKENANKQNEELSFLDIGTGSGCIAVTLKKNFPNSSVFALDNSINALKVARENADRNGCHIRFVQHDIFQKPERSVFQLFNIIVSNPPYVRESEKKEMQKNVLHYEPGNALFVADNDPLSYYKAIADFAFTYLLNSGLLYLEINENFGPDIKALLLTKNFDKVEVIKDINGKDRFIRAELNTLVNHAGMNH
jgi:release factor glutamine methyltransferase